MVMINPAEDCHACSCLPCQKAWLPLGQYQIILHCYRGTLVWITCPKYYTAIPGWGFNPRPVIASPAFYQVKLPCSMPPTKFNMGHFINYFTSRYYEITKLKITTSKLITVSSHMLIWLLRRGFHELSGLHESQESEWRRRFHSSLVLCWRGHHNRWPAYYQQWHWLHSAVSETHRDSRGCHRQWRDVDQQAPRHWWHNVILVEQGCQTSYRPFSTTPITASKLNWGKSSESVQCTMLKACDACADIGEL